MKSCFEDWQELAHASVFTLHFLSSQTGELPDFDTAISLLARGGLHWDFDPCAKRFTAQRRDESGELGAIFEFAMCRNL
jgi:hypothetical protein